MKNDTIHIAQIGCGRIARGHNLSNLLPIEGVRVVAVCDVDATRMHEGKQLVDSWYQEHGLQSDVRVYQDYRELLGQSDIDAVVISTPDHAHLAPCVAASEAGKDIYMEKPMSLTIAEGRIMSDTLRQNRTVFQLGSQQRGAHPWPQFRRACELVRNGRIGQVHTVEVGLPGDPGGGDPTPMPVPAALDYEAWCAGTPPVPYTEDRVHPAQGYGRPGWLRCEQFSAGMITGWGSHHIDTAHWGLGTEHTGPVEVTATAAFPTDDPEYRGLWNVHGPFHVRARYACGATMNISQDYPNGIRFIGTDGWIFVTRGSAVVDGEPNIGMDDSPLQASSPAILSSNIQPDEIQLYDGEEQHANWIRCVKTRDTATAAPPEIAHRSGSACLIAHIAMKLRRTLTWDPEKEVFLQDDEANALRSGSGRRVE